MEKVKIENVTIKDWQGKKFYNITTEDGRVGSSSDAKFLELIGKEVECDVKDSGKEYQNVKQYYFNLQKEGGQKNFPVKNWEFEKRRASLDFATRHDNLGKDPLVLAETFYQYLNKK